MSLLRRGQLPIQRSPNGSAGGPRSSAFHAPARVAALSFSAPAPSGAGVTWGLQIVDPATGEALLQVGGDTHSSWDLERVTQIPTG